MAESDVLDALNAINKTLSRMVNDPNESMGSGGQVRAYSRQESAEQQAIAARMKKSQGDQKAAYDQFNTIYQKQSKTISEFAAASKLTSQSFQSAINNVDVKDLDTKFVKAFQKAISGSKNSVVAQMGNSMDSLTKVMAANIENQSKSAMIGLRQQFEDGGLTLRQYTRAMKQHIPDIVERGKFMRQTTDEFKELEEHTMDLSAAFNNASRQFGASTTDLMKKLKDTLVKTGVPAAAMHLGKGLYDAGTAAAKFGTETNITDGLKLAMSSADISELQAKHKQTIMATSQSYEEYNSLIGEGVYSMRAFTGSIAEGVKLNAQSLTTFRNLGGAVQNQSDYLQDQQQRFQSWNRTFSMTADQFAEFNDQMLNSNSIQSQLYRLDKTKREQTFKDIQQSYEHLRLQGMTNEEAKSVIDRFAELSGKEDPLERFRKSVKMQAFASSMGMGAEGQRMADLMRSGDTSSKEFMALGQAIDSAHAKRMQGPLGQQIGQNVVLSKTDMAGFFGSSGVFRGLETRQDLALDGTAKENAKRVGGISSGQGKVMAGAELAGAAWSGPFGRAINSIDNNILMMVGAKGMGGMMSALKGIRSAGNATEFGGRGVGSNKLAALGTVAAVGTTAFALTTLVMEKTGLQDKLSSALGLNDREAIPQSEYKQDAEVLRVLQEIAKTNTESVYYGKTSAELIKVAQKVNEDTNKEIKNSADAQEAVAKQLNISINQKGSNRTQK